MIRIPTHRATIYPGEMLLEEFLKPMGFTGIFILFSNLKPIY
jgi:hypothetical protein